MDILKYFALLLIFNTLNAEDLASLIEKKKFLSALQALEKTEITSSQQKLQAAVIYLEMGQFSNCRKSLDSIKDAALKPEELFLFHYTGAKWAISMAKFKDCEAVLEKIFKMDLTLGNKIKAQLLKSSLLTTLAKYNEAESILKGLTDGKQIDSKAGMLFGISEDKEGNIWVGTLQGVNRYDGNSLVKIMSSKSLFDQPGGVSN